MHTSSGVTVRRLKYDRPNCPKCGALMWIARIEPDEPDHETRTFECPACDHLLTEVMKYK